MDSDYNSLSDIEKGNLINNLKTSSFQSLTVYTEKVDDIELINDISKSLIKLRNLCANLDFRDKFRSDFISYIFSCETIYKSLTLNDSNIKLFELYIQLIFNFIVQSEENKESIWNDHVLDTIKIVFEKSKSNIKLISLLALLLHNFIVSNSNRITKLIDNFKNELQFLANIISTHSNIDEFYSIYLLFNVLFKEFEYLFNSFSGEIVENIELFSIEQHHILFLFDSILESNGKEYILSLPNETIKFIERLFIKNNTTNNILFYNGKNEDLVISTSYSILQIFSSLASEGWKPDADIVIALIEQLKLAWKHSEPIFKATIHIDHTHKHYGLKVILTQIIANLAHLSRETQDLVRIHEGIVPILNGCQYDEKNPYLREWSIFAIRNLCENNSDNQAIIESIKPQEELNKTL